MRPVVIGMVEGRLAFGTNSVIGVIGKEQVAESMFQLMGVVRKKFQSS